MMNNSGNLPRKRDIAMRIRTFAAVTGTVLLLGTGSALASDSDEALTPAGAFVPVTSQAVPAGADLRIPNVSGISSRSPVFEFQCADAVAKHGENSAQAQTFCN